MGIPGLIRRDIRPIPESERDVGVISPCMWAGQFPSIKV